MGFQKLAGLGWGSPRKMKRGAVEGPQRLGKQSLLMWVMGGVRGGGGGIPSWGLLAAVNADC